MEEKMKGMTAGLGLPPGYEIAFLIVAFRALRGRRPLHRPKGRRETPVFRRAIVAVAPSALPARPPWHHGMFYG